MTNLIERLPERIRRRIQIVGECWVWTGALTNNGYSRIKRRGKTVVGHRVTYEMLVGPIPDGLTLDHLCRCRACINPSHAEPVTQRVNVLRGDTVTARNAVKTHCDRGHLLSGDNLFVRRDGRRRCRTCERASQRKMKQTDRYKQKHAAYERSRRAQLKGA